MDLEELLQREVEVGTYDSTGAFTLSLGEARRKLQNFQLTSLEQAVLKLIQGVVRLEPLAVWMESNERGFVISWADPTARVDPAQFVGEFEKVLLGPDCPEKDFAIGLMGFLDKEPAQVWWAEWSGAQPVSTINLFGGLAQAELRAPPGAHARTFALVVQTGKQKLQLDRQMIATRTLFCPILLLWNGRLMCELSWNPPGHRSSRGPYWADFYFRQPGSLARGIALKPIGTCLRWITSAGGLEGSGFSISTEDYSVHRRYVLGAQGRALVLKGRRPQLSGLSAWMSPGNAVGFPVELRTSLGESIWIVDGAQKGRALLLCVKHGVMLDPCTLPRQLGGTVAVVATPDLEVDLSQFSPILNSPSWQELGQRVKRQASEVVSKLAQEPTSALKELGGNWPWSWAGAGLLAGVVGASLLPIPWFGGFLLSGAGGIWAAKRNADVKFQSRLRALQQAVGSGPD
ncbi:MAG: hypothetical protein KF760_18370 [Candidatus Eremiobacteraeota bacterium]|nr:hypothetical protein [Candidatus Eremiobacteraeota bacterium]MCW5869366.1 hypothetical protein [Candidatus Eremiobacteraeota bacterium]